MRLSVLRQPNCYGLFSTGYFSFIGCEFAPFEFSERFSCFMRHYLTLRLGVTGAVNLGPLLAAGALVAALAGVLAAAAGIRALAGMALFRAVPALDAGV